MLATFPARFSIRIPMSSDLGIGIFEDLCFFSTHITIWCQYGNSEEKFGSFWRNRFVASEK
jgi:hypothetical protein